MPWGPAEIPVDAIDTVGAFAATRPASGEFRRGSRISESAEGGPECSAWVTASATKSSSSSDAMRQLQDGDTPRAAAPGADRFGNPRSMGGDMIEVYAKPRNGQGAREDPGRGG